MRNLTSTLTALLAVVCWFSGPAPAQVRQPAEPKPPPPPFLTVTKTDGTTAKGHLVASDPAALTIRPPAPPGKPANEPLVLKWAEISKVSNGLTRQKVLAEWKGEHRDQLCADCKGEGTVLCATCKGTVHDPAKLPKDCATCKGELLVDCKAPKCDKGQVPCPNKCLKPTDPGWIEHDGKKWRRFPMGRNGYFEASDSHLGEIPVIKGDQASTIPCPTCGTKMKVDCNTCHGLGKISCPTCSKNDAAGKCPDCDKGRQPCKTCEGTGMRK